MEQNAAHGPGNKACRVVSLTLLSSEHADRRSCQATDRLRWGGEIDRLNPQPEPEIWHRKTDQSAVNDRSRTACSPPFLPA